MKTSDRIILLILAFLAIACVRLGFWQLERRLERLTQNDWVSSQLAEAPITEIDEVSLLSELEYRKLRIRGSFLNQHSIVLRNRSYANQPGLHLVTPFAIEGENGAILVDRGWISNEDFISSGITPYEHNDPVELIGIIRTSQTQPSISFLADPTRGLDSEAQIEWKFLTIELIQQQMPFELHPFFIQLSEPVEDSMEMPIPNPEVDLSQGPHLSYAIQWFGFGLIAVGGAIAWYRRIRRRQQLQGGKDKSNNESPTP